MFMWTERSRRWYVEAAHATSCHREQARACLPWLGDVSTIADFGCGPGFLALALAELGRDVTGLDVDEGCIALARTEAARRRLDNAAFRVQNAFELTDRDMWDCVVTCHFGDMGTDWAAFVAHARTMVLSFASRPEEEPLIPGPERRRKRSARDVEASLEAQGVRFDKLDLTFEFGQPFANLDEARLFAAHYSRGTLSGQALDDFLGPRLERTAHGFYLPHKKLMTLFSIPVRP